MVNHVVDRMSDDEIGEVLHALADLTRRRMFERLVRSPLPVSALAEPFSMSLPAAMKHIAVLEECGLIETQKIGRVRTCAVRPGALRELEGWLARQRTAWEARLDALGDHVDGTTRGQES
jgi:DNA-binding transcriptional ArsR family regulator